METTTSTLAAAVRDRIAAAHDGSQAAFSRATGLSPAYVNHLVKGKIAVPSPEYRGVLARELGVRRIDLLVMAGAVTEEEAAELAMPDDPLDPEERRLVDAYRAASPSVRRSMVLVAEELAAVSAAASR